MKLPTKKQNSFVPCNNGSGDDNDNYNNIINDINIIIIIAFIIMNIVNKKIDFTVRRKRVSASERYIYLFFILSITTDIMTVINILRCLSSFPKCYIY